MSAVIDVTFPGGKRVDAHVEGFTIPCDQSVKSGGEGSAPEPSLYLLASIATCMGHYAMSLCQRRGCPTAGMALRMTCHWDDAAKRYARLEARLDLPADFPDKHREAVVRAMDQCFVKKLIMDPPVFDITAG